MRRSYTIKFPHFYNVKNALAHQNNAIEASAIRRIIGIYREKARGKMTFFNKIYYIFCNKLFNMINYMYNIKFNETKMTNTIKLFDDYDIDGFKKRDNQLEFQIEKFKKLMEINKTMVELAIKSEKIASETMSPANNIDYKSNISSKIIKNKEDETENKVETIADKIDDFKKENLKTENIEIKKDIETKDNSSEDKDKEKDDTSKDVESKKTEKTTINIANILSTPKKEENASEKEKETTKEESNEDKEISSEELEAKKLLNEANNLDEEKTAVNNKDYEWTEKEKNTWTDGALIDIKDILK